MSLDTATLCQEELTPVLEKYYKKHYHDYHLSCLTVQGGDRTAYETSIIRDVLLEIEVRHHGTIERLQRDREQARAGLSFCTYKYDNSRTVFQNCLAEWVYVLASDIASDDWLKTQQARLDFYVDAALRDSSESKLSRVTATQELPVKSPDNASVWIAILSAVVILLVVALVLKSTG